MLNQYSKYVSFKGKNWLGLLLKDLGFESSENDVNPLCTSHPPRSDSSLPLRGLGTQETDVNMKPVLFAVP